MTKKLGIFIIAYNAVNHLDSTLSRIPKEIYDRAEEIFVVDDCSTDDTYYAAMGYKREQGLEKLTVHRNKTNQGYGGNQKVGYSYAIEREFDIVAMVHGDGQYAPEMLPKLVKPVDDGNADMVFGSRMSVKGAARKGGMPLYKFLGNRVLTFIQNKLTGLNLSEYHSGYRLYSVDALKQLPFKSFSNGWHFDTQILLAMAERNMRISEMPIPTYYGDEISHVNGIPYAVNCLLHSYDFYRNRKKGFLTYSDGKDIPYIEVGEQVSKSAAHE